MVRTVKKVLMVMHATEWTIVEVRRLKGGSHFPVEGTFMIE